MAKFNEAKDRANVLNQPALKEIQRWCAICAESETMDGSDIAKFAFLRDAVKCVRELATN